MKLFLSFLVILLAATVYGYAVISPKVETAPASVRIGRSRSPLDPIHVEVEAFGEVHNLRLLPAPSPLSEDFSLQTVGDDEDDDGILIIQDMEDDEIVADLFHDPETGAVVSIEGEKVEGIITPSLTLTVTEEGNHEAIKQYSPVPAKPVTDYLNVPEGVLRGEPSAISRDNRGTVSVNPEVYVIVDSTMASKLGRKVKQYLSVFWNGVNQRFATISDPKINIVLAGAMIFRKPKYESFINNNKLMDNYIHGEKTLNSVSDWLFKKRGRLPKYDLAYLMTGKDMADVESGVIKEGLAGIAWKGAACLVSDFNKRSFNTGMGEDKAGYYTGVMTAAHEVAHNLGSPHDGDAGATSCSWDLGYIMSYVSGNPNKLFFSSCSQKNMKDYMLTSDADCLKTTGAGSKIPISSKLPGELVTMDEQCQKITGKDEAYASKSADEDSLCVQLVCQWQVKKGYSIWTYTQTSGRPAAEGSACRSGGKCTDGSCQ